eukprot:SAG22_NODE_486_length_9885_cov_2.043634_3_plen_167_part_00
MSNADIRESEYITLEEAACLTGKSVHTLRKAAKTRPIRYHDDVRNGRRVLVMSRVDLLKFYKSVDQLASRLDQRSQSVGRTAHDIDLLMENISFLKVQLENRNQELKYKNEQFESMGDQIKRKDEQIKHLHIMMRHFQKEGGQDLRQQSERKLDEELEALGKLSLE